MAKGQLRRYWDDVNEKFEEEAPKGCRLCGSENWLERAHTVNREDQDIPVDELQLEYPERYDYIGSRYDLYVNPDSIIVLCKKHHMQFDANAIGVMDYLTLAEQVNAVLAAGGIILAVKKLDKPYYNAIRQVV